MSATLVLFVIDNDFGHLYFTTPDKYSQVLRSLGIRSERVKFKTIPLESLLLMLDGQTTYIKR